MDNSKNAVSANELRDWMDSNEPVFILDVRPLSQREEWQIPGSHYLDAYKRLNENDNSVLDELEIPENTKVVTVCAAGRTSQLASEALRKKGVDAYSLEGGMKAWSVAWNIAEKTFEQFTNVQFRRTGKGCLSYILYSGTEAAILDASLPVSVYSNYLQEKGLTVKYVLETHIHADHLSRSKEVAEQLNAPLFLPQPNKVKFPHDALMPGTILTVGNASLELLATPGHTLDSVCFYIRDQVIFTGDTLFIDGVGRPDLKADENETRNKATSLYQSLQKIMALPQEVIVLPAHTNKPAAFDGSLIAATIAQVKQQVAMLQKSEPDFIYALLQKIPPTPANYLAIVEKNLTGDYSDVNPLDLEAGANRCAIS